MKPKYTWVLVEGGGSFPMDMLRYDACYPHSESDARTAENLFKKRKVMLHIAENSVCSRMGPTERRWESFIWKVLDYGDSKDIERGFNLQQSVML